MLSRFLPREAFSSYDDFLKNYRVEATDAFNFAVDVVDAWAEAERDKSALVWCNDHGDERRFSFGDISLESARAAVAFRRMGIRKGDAVLLLLKRRWQFWVYAPALMRLGAIYREKFGLPWHVVRHEAVIEDFEAETRRACDFLGIEWTAEMHRFAERARQKPVATPSAAQVVRGLNRDGMAQWRHYAAQMEPALPFLKPWIETFGYSAE